MDCCDPNGLESVFAGPLVRWELRAYRRRGLNRRQRAIVALLGPLAPETSVLDIGCGIGALGTTLLAQGAGEGTFVDLSSAYLRAAREVVAEAGVAARAALYRDDFATSVRPYPRADVVLLDRVVCCYPEGAALLEKVARHSSVTGTSPAPGGVDRRRTLVYTYPRPLWFMPLLRALCALGMRLTGRRYRFFLHDPEVLLRAATAGGGVHVTTRRVGVWGLVRVSRG